MPTTDDLQPSEAFEIAFIGRGVELLFHPPGPDTAPPTPEAVLETLRRSPLQSIDGSRVTKALADHASAASEARIAMGTVPVPPYDGSPCVIVVSMDRLAAYAVPANPPPEPPPDPPAADLTGDTAVREEAPAPLPTDPPAVPLLVPPPPIVTAAELRTLLAAAGIVGGLLDDVIDGFGTGAPLPDARCVARGQQPIPGADARLEYHFEVGAARLPMPSDEHGSVDFHELAVQRFVSEGAPLITRHPTVPGTAGYDVLGVASEPPRPQDVEIARLAGPNTTLDGDVVTSKIVGRPVVGANGSVEVLPVFEVAGDVDYAVGNIDFPGDVIVRGDVKSGFSIVSGGSVSVQGLVERASITAAHDLSVMGAVGEHQTLLRVGGNLNARYLHSTDAQVVGTANVAGEIVNCTITAERVLTAAQGRIVGGLITAETGVDTGTIGSRDGQLTEIRLTSSAPEAVVRARRTAQPGVVVLIGQARKQIEDPIDGVSFWDVKGTILTLKATADLAAAEAARAA